MSENYVGEIFSYQSEELRKYTDKAQLIADYAQQIECCGINSAEIVVYNENDLDLRFQVAEIQYGEVGEKLPKKQFLINSISPEFRLQDKLQVIYEYENRTDKKHRITDRSAESIYRLTDGVLDNLSIKAIKNLVNRQYDKATKNKQGKKREREDLTL